MLEIFMIQKLRDGLLQLGLPSRSSGRRETTKDVEKGVRSPCSCLWFAF